MNKLILQEDWYQQLVEECKSIITEAVFTSRWALVEGYWTLGQRIRLDKGLIKWSQNEAGQVLQGLAKDIGKSERTIYNALAVFDKFKTLDEIPEGKNISMNKLINLYLPQPKKEKIVLPKGKYRVIYADPPWKYGNMQHSVDEQETTLDTHYPTMDIDELCQMDIQSLTEENAVLFIWTTSPFLEKVFKVINAWGFDYKTSMIWDKVKHNVGYYVSVRHEFLLICTKGSCLPDSNKLIDSVQEIERSNRHSEKPQKFYEIIETMYNGPYIELFSRKKEVRKNWTYWGNESKI